MLTILYFAYGSNMYTPRLRYRVPGCRFRAIAQLANRRLRFHKRSADKSGKCNAYFTERSTDCVFGAVYEIPQDEKTALDRAEGLGQGYHEECVRVLPLVGQAFDVRTYVADPDAIDDHLKPYSWYKEFVLNGAEEHQLPDEYIGSYIRSVAAAIDANQKREQSRRAEVKF